MAAAAAAAAAFLLGRGWRWWWGAIHAAFATGVAALAAERAEPFLLLGFAASLALAYVASPPGPAWAIRLAAGAAHTPPSPRPTGCARIGGA